jgi:hypothetical protein
VSASRAESLRSACHFRATTVRVAGARTLFAPTGAECSVAGTIAVVFDPADGDGATGRRARLLLPPHLVAKAVFVVGAVVLSTVVLWLRQTPEALLRVASFPGGLAEVGFWALPSFVLYVLLARSPVTIAVDGFALTVILSWGWWSYATDWHSTASLGPAGTGWFFGPIVVVAVRLIERVARRRRAVL